MGPTCFLNGHWHRAVHCVLLPTIRLKTLLQSGVLPIPDPAPPMEDRVRRASGLGPMHRTKNRK